MKIEKAYIERLKAAIEQSVMRPIRTSKDFEYLYDEIHNRINKTVGVSTLKRLWGYIDGYQSVRESTLDELCRFMGFPDWHTFVADHCNVESEQTSHRVVSATLPVEDIGVSERVLIEWNPDRQLLLNHHGGGDFTVVEAKNSKVVAGDSFRCERFVIGQPLYMGNFVHGNEPPALFVVGKQGGLTKVVVLDSEDN